MIEILGKLHTLPAPLYIALSGGSDSMACLDFIRNGRHDITAIHFNHGTEHGKDAEKFVREYCAANKVPLITDSIKAPRDPKQSPEEYWRNARYAFFNSLKGTIITCHHLNDQVENWLFTAMNGNPLLIPHKNKNVVRPFLLTPRAELRAWCQRRNVPWIEDPSNTSVKHPRNRIRHNIMPEILQINPGIEKVVARKVKEMYNDSQNPRLLAA